MLDFSPLEDVCLLLPERALQEWCFQQGVGCRQMFATNHTIPSSLCGSLTTDTFKQVCLGYTEEHPQGGD